MRKNKKQGLRQGTNIKCKREVKRKRFTKSSTTTPKLFIQQLEVEESIAPTSTLSPYSSETTITQGLWQLVACSRLLGQFGSAVVFKNWSFLSSYLLFLFSLISFFSSISLFLALARKCGSQKQPSRQSNGFECSSWSFKRWFRSSLCGAAVFGSSIFLFFSLQKCLYFRVFTD